MHLHVASIASCSACICDMCMPCNDRTRPHQLSEQASPGKTTEALTVSVCTANVLGMKIANAATHGHTLSFSTCTAPTFPPLANSTSSTNLLQCPVPSEDSQGLHAHAKQQQSMQNKAVLQAIFASTHSCADNDFEHSAAAASMESSCTTTLTAVLVAARHTLLAMAGIGANACTHTKPHKCPWPRCIAQRGTIRDSGAEVRHLSVPTRQHNRDLAACAACHVGKRERCDAIATDALKCTDAVSQPIHG